MTCRLIYYYEGCFFEHQKKSLQSLSGIRITFRLPTEYTIMEGRMATSYIIPLPSGVRMKVFYTGTTDKRQLIEDL